MAAKKRSADDAPSNSAPPRKRRRDRKACLEILVPLLEKLNWDAADLASRSGVSQKTIQRMLEGKYVHKANSDLIEKALRQHTSATLFIAGQGRRKEDDLSDDAELHSPLEMLYKACSAAPLQIRESIRVDEFQQLIRDRMLKFVGRNWLFDALDRFLHDEPQGYFVLRGAPGVGKTSFAAAITMRKGCVHHFNSRFTRLNKTGQFLANVCSQLIVTYKLPHTVLPSRTTQDSGVLVELLSEINRQRPAEKVLLVVDAVDETIRTARDISNPLSLPPRLPENAYVLLTTRDTDCVLRLESPGRTLYLDQSSSDNLADIQTFYSVPSVSNGNPILPIQAALTSDAFVRMLEEKSQGNFMFLRHVLPEIERGRYANRDWHTIPEGLINYYESHWVLLREHDRTAWLHHKLPILRILATASQPVSLQLLCDRLRDVPRDLIHDVLEHDWRQFLEHVTTSVSGKKVTGWRLYHASFSDFLRQKSLDPDEQVDLERERDAWFAYGQAQGMTPD